MVAHGVLLPTRGVYLFGADPAERVRLVDEQVVGLAAEAEGLGFDSVWVGDSVLAKHRLEPLVALAAVARATADVTLGTAVHLPTLRHPANVAHQALTVDHLSGGRLAFGIGVGTGALVRDEYAQYGLPYDRRGAMLDEVLEVLRGFWEDGTVSFDGEFFSLDGASLGARPATVPPVYVASSDFDPTRGFPRRIERRLVEHGDGWLPLSMTPEMYRAGLDRIETALADAGRDPDAFEALYYQDVVIANSHEAAVEEALAFFEDYGAVPRTDVVDTDDDVMPFERRGVFGTPEDVRAHLERYREAGVEHFVTRFPSHDQQGQVERYAEIIG